MSDRTSLGRWMLYIAGGLVALVLLVALLLPRLFSDAQLKALVIPPLEEATGRTVTIDGIALRVLPSPAVSVSDFAIANAEGFGDAPFVSGQELNVEVALWPLLTGTIEPTAVELVAPTVRYEIADDGTTNVDDLAAADTTEAPPAEESAPAIGVSNIRMTDAHILYRDRSTGQSADVAFGAQMSVLPTDGGALDSEGTLDVASIRALLPDVSSDTLAVQNARLAYDVRAALNDGQINVRSFRLETPPLTAQTSGTISDLNTRPAVDLALETTETDLAALANFLPADAMPGVAPRGAMQVSVQMRGPLPDSTGSEGFSLDGTGQLTGLGVDYEGTTYLQDLSADLALSLESAGLQNIQGRLLGEPLEGRIAVSDLMGEAQLDGQLAGAADLGRLSGLAASDAEAESTMEVSGRAEYDVRFSGTASDPSSLRATGPITVSDLRYRTTPATFREPLVIPEATFRLTGTGLSANRFPMQSGTERMALQFAARNLLPADRAFAETNPALVLDFTFTSDELDLVALFPEGDDTEPTYGELFAAQLSGSDVRGRSPEDVAQEMYGDVEIPAFAVDGRVEIGTLLNDPQRFDDLAMDMRVRNRRLDVQNLSAQTYGGSLAGSITLDQSAAAASAYVRPARTSVLMAAASSAAGVAAADGAAAGVAAAPKRSVAFPLPDTPTALAYDLALDGAKASAFLSEWTRLGNAITGTLNLRVAGDSPLRTGFLPIADALTASGSSVVADGGFEEGFGLASALVNRLGISRPSFTQFRRLGGPFAIRNGAIELTEWEMNNAVLQGSTLSGSIGLGGAVNLQLGGEMPLGNVRGSALAQGSGLGEILQALSGEDGTVPLQVGIGGTMNDPEVAVDREAFQRALQDLVPNPGRRLRNLFNRGGGGGGGR